MRCRILAGKSKYPGARISARISTGNLCSDLPTHGHGNRLLESVNDKIRDEIVTKHVKAGNTSTKTVMQELSGY